MLFVAILTLFSMLVAQARIITEDEPNGSFSDARLIQCGDTVQCAHLDGQGADFFRFFVSAGDSVYLRTFACDANEDTYLLLYDQSRNLLTLDDDSGEGDFSLIGWFGMVAETCFVQVLSPSGSSVGPYNLSIDCQYLSSGPHDLCNSARSVAFFPYYDESTTSGAASEVGNSSPDVFYKLELATPGDVFVQVCSEFFDSRVQLLTFCVGGYLDDSNEGACQLGADLYLFALQTQEYYLVVEGASANQSGDFSIEVSPAFAECPAASALRIFTVADAPFLDWPDVPDADYYLIEGALNGEGPFEAIATTSESYWQDSNGFALARRFYRVRSICQ